MIIKALLLCCAIQKALYFNIYIFFALDMTFLLLQGCVYGNS